jgi:hypothetical protein
MARRSGPLWVCLSVRMQRTGTPGLRSSHCFTSTCRPSRPPPRMSTGRLAASSVPLDGPGSLHPPGCRHVGLWVPSEPVLLRATAGAAAHTASRLPRKRTYENRRAPLGPTEDDRGQPFGVRMVHAARLTPPELAVCTPYSFSMPRIRRSTGCSLARDRVQPLHARHMANPGPHHLGRRRAPTPPVVL